MSIESAKVISLTTKTSQGKNNTSPAVSELNEAEVSDSHTNSLGNVMILLEGEQVLAKVAFSCLVQPDVNDRVLISKDSRGDFFILSILERVGQQDMTMAFPGSASLQSIEGSINILSSQSVSMTSPKLQSISEESIYKSNKAYVNIENLNAKGGLAHISFSQLRLFSDMINTVAKQAIHRFQGYIRQTTSADQVKAGQMTRDVEGLYSMNSNHTLMLSKKDTKIDAERIHMG